MSDTKQTTFNAPVILEGGVFGFVIRIDDARGMVGVQVPGAEDIRWLHDHEVEHMGGGALRLKS